MSDDSKKLFPNLNEVVYIGDSIYVGCNRFRELEVVTSNGLVVSKPIVFDVFAASSLIKYIQEHIGKGDIA